MQNLTIVFDLDGTLVETAPDLIAQSINVSPNPVLPGSNITVSWTLRNQGSGTANSSTTVVRIESSANCPIVAQAQVSASSLGAGQSISQSTTMTAPASGQSSVSAADLPA